MAGFFPWADFQRPGPGVRPDTPRTVTALTLCGLVKIGGESPFPAFAQLEFFGQEA